MNTYYLVPAATLASFRAQHVDASTLPHQVLHYRVSLDGQWYIVQAEVTDAEDRWAQRQSGVTLLGYFREDTGRADQSVLDYLAANPVLWSSIGPA